MKAKNFRIGNFVNAGFKSEVKRTKHKMTGSCILDLYANAEKCVFDYAPIILKDSTFLNFGFYKDEMGYLNIDDSIYSFVDREELGYMLVVADIEYKETYIKYEHELQNLFFALTGTELEVKHEVSV